MTASLVLVVYALIVGTFGVRWLCRASWPVRAPRLGVLAWQALSGSVLASIALAGLALAVPVWPVSADLAGFLDTCVMLVRAQYSTPGGAVVGGLGALMAIAVMGRPGYCFAASSWTAHHGRVLQREQLALLARHDVALNVLVLDHATCAAYCVPGRGGQIVVTSATLGALDADQVAAVLAHERAHLRGRHHLVLRAASSLREAFPFVPAFAYAAAEVARLTEMIADDAAAHGRDRLTLATALVRLAEGSTPVGALGAGGSTAVARVRRLAAPTAPLGVRAQLAALTGVFVLAAVPFVVTAAPALAVASANYCPVSLVA